MRVREQARQFKIPAFHGSTPIGSYQIRWSANTGHTWTAWVSTKKHRHTTRTGLRKGKAYLVAVRARNHSRAGLVVTRTFTQHR